MRVVEEHIWALGAFTGVPTRKAEAQPSVATAAATRVMVAFMSGWIGGALGIWTADRSGRAWSGVLLAEFAPKFHRLVEFLLPNIEPTKSIWNQVGCPNPPA